MSLAVDIALLMVSGNVRRAYFALLGFCLASLFNGLALSAEVGTRTSGQNVYLHFDGPITQGDFAKVERAFRRKGYLTEVWLDSPGGNVAEAMRIGQFIRDNLIATFVPKAAECHSACPLILLGGIIRRAHTDTTISVHMSSMSRSDKVKNLMLDILIAEKYSFDMKLEYLIQLFENFGARGILKQVLYIGRMGASYELLEVIVATPHYEVTKLNRGQLRRFNILTE